MKKIFITLAVLCSTFTGGAYGQSCCAKPTGMSALALNMEFKAAHDAPNPFNYAPENGRMMEVKFLSMIKMEKRQVSMIVVMVVM